MLQGKWRRWLIHSVEKPCSASDIDNNLTQIIDMGGYWSRITYDADVYVTGIEKADGLWQVWIEPSDSSSAGYYNAPGTPMWANYRITITDPEGRKEEYFYDGYTGKGGM